VLEMIIVEVLQRSRLIEHGFTSAPTQYRLYGRRFLQRSNFEMCRCMVITFAKALT